MKITDDQRKELISYYKWIVSLSTFLLTLSLGFLALKNDALRFVWIAVLSQIALFISIFLNFLLVRNLIGWDIAGLLSPKVKREEILADQILQRILLQKARPYGVIKNDALRFLWITVLSQIALFIRKLIGWDTGFLSPRVEREESLADQSLQELLLQKAKPYGAIQDVLFGIGFILLAVFIFLNL